MALGNNRGAAARRPTRGANKPGINLVMPSGRLRLALCLFLTLAFMFVPDPSAAQTSGREPDSRGQSESAMKAFFLVGIAKFIEWPPETFRGPQAPVVIAVLGQDPFGESLENLLLGKTLSGHPWIIVHARHVEDVMQSQILFISSSEARREQRIIEKLQGRSILTVGERKDFIRHGGMVNFVHEGNMLRFEINPDAGARARVKISSQLLSLAKIVRDEAPRKEGMDVQP